MKILIIGACGTIGKRVTAELATRHEIITAGRNSGDIRLDITTAMSIKKVFSELKNLDACILTPGSAYSGDFQTLTEDQLNIGIKGKLMGQVNTVLIGQHYLNDCGSFTLTSGVLAEDPTRNSTGLALVNGAINSFVLAASRELKRGLRINGVSPGLVEDSLEKYKINYPGENPVSMIKVVNAYVKSVEGVINGQIVRIHD